MHRYNMQHDNAMVRCLPSILLCLQPTGEQVYALQEAFLNCASACQLGIQFNGATYKCIRADKDSIFARKVQYLETVHSKISTCPFTAVQNIRP